MKLLFITMVWPDKKQENMYSELMGEFTKHGHDVKVVALTEKRRMIPTHAERNGNLEVLFVRCGNMQKVGKYEKVIHSFFAGIKMDINVFRYFRRAHFDCIIFALPPLTLAPFIKLIKKYFQTKLYLLLKEFWPHDPTDLGAMKKGGLVWNVFRCLEKMLYKSSDYIGTMSEAGIEFVKKNNPHIEAILEVCPNSQKPFYLEKITDSEKEKYCLKYGIPIHKCVFVFGGNLGISQGINEMIAQICAVKDMEDVFFLIVGDGTEYQHVHKAFSRMSDTFVKVLPFVPREEFDKLLSCCDVGLLFLHPNYTVPNIPSRFVSYIMMGLPVLAAIDNATDIGDIIAEAGCGISLHNGDIKSFKTAVHQMLDRNMREQMSTQSQILFNNKYTVNFCYHTIIFHFKN